MKLTHEQLMAMGDGALVNAARLVNSGNERGILDLTRTGFNTACRAGLLPEPLRVGPRTKLVPAGAVRRFIAQTQVAG